MGFTAGDFVARSLRPARFVVAPSQSGVAPLALRLRLGGLGDKCEQVAVSIFQILPCTRAQFQWAPVQAVSGFKVLLCEPRPIPKCRRATKPKAQDEWSPSSFARRRRHFESVAILRVAQRPAVKRPTCSKAIGGKGPGQVLGFGRLDVWEVGHGFHGLARIRFGFVKFVPIRGQGKSRDRIRLTEI